MMHQRRGHYHVANPYLRRQAACNTRKQNAGDTKTFKQNRSSCCGGYLTDAAHHNDNGDCRRIRHSWIICQQPLQELAATKL